MASKKANSGDTEIKDLSREFSYKLEVSVSSHMENIVLQLGPKHDESNTETSGGEQSEEKSHTGSETEEETDTEFPDVAESKDECENDSADEETDTDFGEPVVYKDKHKIGSRKASEGVITYNEPMYQSLINNMFDTVKRSSPVKSKNSDSSRSKSLNSSPIKRPNVDLERSLSFESVIKVKKKIMESDNVRLNKCEKRHKAAVKKEKKQPFEKANKPKIVHKTNVGKQTIKSEQKELHVDFEQKRKEEQKRIKSYCKKNLQKTEKKNAKIPKSIDTKTKKNQRGDCSVNKKVNISKTDEDRKTVKKSNSTKNVQKVISAKTQSKEHKNAKETVSKTKPVVPKRRLKREASLNAVTFMNLLYEKEESSPPKTTDCVAKRSKSETDIQTVVKKHKRHSTPESLAAFQETIDEVVQRIRAENTINEVVERIKCEVNDDVKAINDKSFTEINRQNSDEPGLNDDVFEKDKFDLIKIKGNVEKHRNQTNKKTLKTPVIKLKKTKEIENRSPEEIAEKKRKANLARLKKAKEILKQGKIRSMKTGTDKNEKKLLNMKLSKLSVILKRKQKKDENKEQVKSPKNALIRQKGKSKDQIKQIQKEKQQINQPRKPKKEEKETFRSARTHMESPKRVIRRSSCQCCQSYYQNQGTSFWSNRNVVNRGSYNQEPCLRSSYSQETFPSNVVNRQSYNPEPCPGPSSELPASPSVDIHPYSSPTHVPMVDNNPYLGQLVPTHYPQCNSCTCVHGALCSAPCPQCAIGGVPLLTCHHQGYSNTYPVTFPHSHGTFSHTCGCTYCSSGSFHPSSSPMIHQTIRADAPYLVHHSVPLQLPHESSHPLPVQLSHNERPPAPITHQVSQVSHGDMNSMHLSHVYGVPHNELSSATTVNSMVPVDQDLIDVGQDNLSENTNMGSQRHSSSSDNMKKDNVKKDSAKLQSSSSKSSSNKENGCSDKKVQKVKDGETKSVKPKQKRLKSTEDEENIKLENRSGNTKLKRKRSDDDKKEETVGVKKPKIKTESQEDVTIKQNVTTKLKDSAKEKDTVKQKETVKQKSTAKPSDTLKQNSTTQLKGLNTLKQKDALKKAKPKEVKIEVKEIKKKERKSSGGNKEKVQRSVSSHGWAWEGEPEVRTLTGIFDGKQVTRKCYKAIKHDDGDIIQIKDCILVCSGARSRDMPYVAKVTNFWEEPHSGEMMMTLLWYYRPEHTEGGRQPYHKDCEVFAAKHRDESPVACIDDRCYVLTYNEYCRFLAEVARSKYDLPPRDKVVPDPEEPYPCRRIPPVDLDPENVLLCRHVYDFKLKRVLKNPS